MGRLRSELVEIPLAGGMRQDLAERLVGSMGFPIVQNMLHDKTGEFAKRNGYLNQAKTTVAGGTLTECKQLATRKDELLLFEGNTPYVYSDDANEWKALSTHWISRCTESVVYNSNDSDTEQLHCTVKYANGIFVWVFNGTYYVQEESTGTILRTGALPSVNATTNNARAAVLGDDICVVYWSSTATNLNMLTFDTLNPEDAPTSNLGVVTTFARNGDADFDVIEYSTTKCVIVNRSSGASANRVEARGFDSSGTSYGGGNLSAAAMVSPIGGAYGGSDKFYAVWVESANLHVVRAANFTFDGTTITPGTEFVVETYADVNDRTDAIVCGDDVAGTGTVFYEKTDASEPAVANGRKVVRIATFGNPTPGAPSLSTLAVRVGIGSKPFRDSSEYFLALVYGSNSATLPRQNTGFLVSASGEVVSRWLIGRAGTNSNRSTFTDAYWSDIAELGSSKYVIAAAKSSHVDQQLTGAALQLQDIYGIANITHEFGKHSGFAEIGDNCFLAHGMLSHYDGSTIQESGFHLYPQGVSIAAAGGAASNLTDTEVYKWVVIYEWYDAQGNLYRSAPSEAATLTFAAGDQPLLTIPTLPLTAKSGVVIRIYRTEGNGSIYYSETTVANDATVSTVTSNVGVISDANILSSPTLYTTGGVLDHIAPPPPRRIVVHNNRLFVVTGDDEIWFSKSRVESFGVQFNDGLKITTDPAGGRVASLASQDGQLIIAKEKNIQRVYGEGPNDAGTDGGYSEPIPVSSDIGCRYLNPMFSWGRGTLIPSHKGMWILTRDLTAEYIGGPIQDDYDGTADIVAMYVVRGLPEIRVLLGGTTHARFDYTENSWARITGLGAMADGVVWRGKEVFSSAAAAILEGDSSYTDTFPTGAAIIESRFETGWIVPGKLFEYSRLWWIYVLGEWKSAHTLNIKITHEDDSTESFSKAMVSDTAPYIVRMMPAVQSGRAFKITVWDSGISGTGDAAIWTALGLEFGVSGRLRVPPAQTL